MVFGPPQHDLEDGLLHPKCGHSTRLRSGFDFRSGPIPNLSYRKFHTAHSGLYAERRRLNRDGGSYQGARFRPQP